MACIVRALIFQSAATLAAGAAFTCTGTYCPTYSTVKSIFVDGNEIAQANFFTDAQLTNIEKDISVQFNNPAFTMGSSNPDSYFQQTCGLGTLNCPASSFYLTPGMSLSTISTRDRAMATNTGSWATQDGAFAKQGPTIGFTPTHSTKQYSFLMVDAFSKHSIWGGIPGFLHYGVYNINSTNGALSAQNVLDLMNKYVQPGLSVNQVPNVYTFQVWEHDHPIALTAQGTPTASWGMGTTNMQTWLTASGLAGAGNLKLVALNYMKVSGTVYTKAGMCKSAASVPVYAPYCNRNCSDYTANDLMCYTAPASPSPTTSFGAMAFEVKLITAFTLVLSSVHGFFLE